MNSNRLALWLVLSVSTTAMVGMVGRQVLGARPEGDSAPRLASSISPVDALQPPGFVHHNGAAPAAEAVLPVFSYNEHLLLPLRVHILHAAAAPDAQCALNSKDVTRILAKVNSIWKQAGIQFYLESLVVEDAGGQELYRPEEQNLLVLRPTGTLAEKMLHVFYIHQMAPNGIFMGRDGIFVKETAYLRPVEGGIDEPLPRVTAHELGHALHLPHRQAVYNLMASGTTGTSLNITEIETTRTAARSLNWTRTPFQLGQVAEQASARDQKEQAVRLYTCLAQIPGDSPLKEAARKWLSMKTPL